MIESPQEKTASQKTKSSERSLISVITPAYNESAIITKNLGIICDYLRGLEDRYRWEILVVNDGSKDETGKLADEFAAQESGVRVIHHPVNRNLGGAMQTGFANARGDYILVMDLDLSYAPEHIGRMMDAIERTDADMVIASPYMKGGTNVKVPPLRLLMSKVVNRFMSFTANSDIHTFTGMVRVYKRGLIQKLNLKSNTYSINPEIIYKSLILRARIVEIPGHLDWTEQVAVGNTRTSSIRIFKGILSGLMSGFIFRPYAFFIVVGLIMFLISLYPIGWIFYHVFSIFPYVEIPVDAINATGSMNDKFTEAVRIVFNQKPHAFFIGGISLIVAFQFLGIGFLSLQNKRYFDELFHLGSGIKRNTQEVPGKE